MTAPGPPSTFQIESTGHSAFARAKSLRVHPEPQKMSLAKQVVDAKDLAAQRPDYYLNSLSTKEHGSVQKLSWWTKRWENRDISVKDGVFTYQSSNMLWSSKKSYSMSTLLRMEESAYDKFAMALMVKDRPKTFHLRCASAEDMRRWKTALLLNAGIAGAPGGGPPKTDQNNTAGGTDTTAGGSSPEDLAASPARAPPPRAQLPPNPKWLTEQRLGAELWKTSRYDTRAEKHTPDVLAFANTLGKLQKSVSFEMGWPWAAWGVDIVQQLLETPSEERAKAANVITPTFFIALLTINGRIKDKDRLYAQVQKTFEDYQLKVVLPAIAHKSGTEQLKEFVHRWELHKIFSEYMRRIFIDLDKNTDGRSRESMSALALKNFANLWSLGKEDLVDTMLQQVQYHRDQSIDEGESCEFLEQCVEILCVMGVTKSPKLRQIKYLVNPTRANKGRFTVMPELELLTDVTTSSAAFNSSDSSKRMRKIVVSEFLSVYKGGFEEQFITATRNYCDRLSLTWLTTETVPGYLRNFQSVYAAENKRVNLYLHPSTRKRLQRACVQHLLSGGETGQLESRLLRDEHSGLTPMLKQRRLDDIANVFECFQLVDAFEMPTGLSEVADLFQQWIVSEGVAFRQQRQRQVEARRSRMGRKYKPMTAEPAYVEQLLALHKECAGIRQVQFRNEALFQKAMNTAFEQLVNYDWGGKKAVQTESFLVESMHLALLGGKDAKGMRLTTEQIKTTCFRVLDLFDHLYSKDRFIETYKHLLRERLLDPAYKEYGLEAEILSRLKLKAGQVNQMEVMLRDVTLVKGLRQDWLQHVAARRTNTSTTRNDGRDKDSSSSSSGTSTSASTVVKVKSPVIPDMCKYLQPIVLTSSSWVLPREPAQRMQIPYAAEAAIAEFTQYYSDKYQQRKLNFRHDLTNVILSFKGSAKTSYRISMVAPQACLLLLFNAHEKLTIPEIQDKLNLSQDKVKQLLMTLLVRPSKSCKTGIVVKHMQKGQRAMPLLPTDTFGLAPQFHHAKRAFAVKRPARAPVVIQMPRRNVRLEAALVRTMKASKVMTERELIRRAMNQVAAHFKPDVLVVKRVVEDLVKRGYMKRNQEDHTKLDYLA